MKYIIRSFLLIVPLLLSNETFSQTKHEDLVKVSINDLSKLDQTFSNVKEIGFKQYQHFFNKEQII